MLSGRSDVELLPPDGDVTALGIAAFTHAVGPLLGYWVERGVLSTSSEAGRVLELHLRHGRARADRSAADLERVLEATAGRSIPTVLLKGQHLARAHYPDVGARPSADIDVLVPPERAVEAVAALQQAGYALKWSGGRPRKYVFSAPDYDPVPPSLELTHERGPLEIDLHTALMVRAQGVQPEIRAGSAQSRSVVTVGGREADVLDPARNLAFLALHASADLHGLTLGKLVDLILVARGASDRFEQLDILELVEPSHRPILYPALALAERLAPGTFDARLLERLSLGLSPALRDRIARLQPETAQRLGALPLGEAFVWPRTPRHYARQLLFLISPSVEPVRVYKERWFRGLRRLGLIRASDPA